MTTDFHGRAEAALSAPVMALLTVAGRVADQADRRLLVVGGVVRDVLLGRATEDVDLVVVGPAAPLVERLASALEAAVEGESRFRTWRLLLPDGRRLDLAEARRESYASGGALPTIAAGEVEEDLARRDFAINAMAVQLGSLHLGSGQGELIDPHEGVRDLEKGLLRILHPASFDDDPSRILRGLELAQRLDFEFDPTTRAAARRALGAGALGTLSPARFRTAWRRSFGRLIERGEAALLAGLESAADLGLLAALRTELSPELRRTAGRVALTQAAGARDRVEGSRLLMRAFAGDDGATARHLADLWSSRTEAATEWEALGPKIRTLRQDAAGLELPSQVASALAGFDEEELRLLHLLSEESIDRLLRVFRQRVLTTRLTVSGRDLIARGYASGPWIGAALAATRDARLDGSITAADELEYACSRLEAASE